jgi:hypothetical protein
MAISGCLEGFAEAEYVDEEGLDVGEETVLDILQSGDGFLDGGFGCN